MTWNVLNWTYKVDKCVFIYLIHIKIFLIISTVNYMWQLSSYFVDTSIFSTWLVLLHLSFLGFSFLDNLT